MTALLERGKINASRGPVFDEVVVEFTALNRMRNNYFHGLWSTHESGRVFLKEPTDDDLDYMPGATEVTQAALDGFIDRTQRLQSRIVTDLEIQAARGKLSARSLEVLAQPEQRPRPTPS